MAKRCLEHFSLENVSHDFMIFSDFSFLVDNPYYGTNVGNIDSKISSYGDNICSIHSSDSEYLHVIDGTSALWQKELSTSYSGYTNFNMWLNNFNTIVISNGMLTREVSSRYVYWAVILDDEEEIGWVVARHVDGKCYVCGGHNDTGALIYYAFTRGIISPSGGAGSGYIGNSLLSNKKMVGYNVPTSSVESTKTESINEASESPVSGKPKIGNGFAKIKLVREAKKLNLFDRFKTTDTTHYKQSSSGVSTYDFKVPNDMLQYAQTDWIIFWGARNKRMPTINNGLITFANTGGASESCVLIPLNAVSDVISFELSVRLSNIPYSNAYAHVGLMNYDATDGFSFLADTDLVYIYGDNVPSVNEWFTFKKYFSGVKADYLAIMYLIDGQHEIKDLKIEYLN